MLWESTRGAARRRGLRRTGRIGRTAALTAVLALALAACGSPTVSGEAAGSAPVADNDGTDTVADNDGTDAAAGADNDTAGDDMDAVADLLEQMGLGGLYDDGDGPDGEGQDEGQTAAPPIVWRVPATPAGDDPSWQRMPAVCEDPEAPDSAFIGLAVPGDWERRGSGSAGGSPLRVHFDYIFDTPEVGDVWVSLTHDSEVDIESPTMPTTPFDHEVTWHTSEGSVTYQIVFDPLGTVAVGDGEAELFVARPGQDPDGGTEATYKARVRHLDLPNRMWDGTWIVTEESFMIAVEYDTARGEVPEETIRGIVASLTKPACAQERVVVEYEAMWGFDLDGDGHVATMEEYGELLGLDW